MAHGPETDGAGKMKTRGWLFKRLNLSLRAEVIINISLLMLVAILLIGYTVSKINEKNILGEKINSAVGMVRDFQAVIDFTFKSAGDLSAASPQTRRELQEFVLLYAKERGLLNLLITDPNLNVVASLETIPPGQSMPNPSLRVSIQTGRFSTHVEKSGNFFTARYEKLAVYSPLWIQGRMFGGVQLEVPIGDIMTQLLESQRVILVSIILDALVLIVFGSFLLSRVLVTPLKDLVQLTQNISEGDFDQKIEVTSKNEIGQLIASFNRMIDRLKENEESLQNYLDSLESANKKLKQAQEELVRSEKLASIGRFAAGVAHEVGNPLGAILGYTSILERDGIESEEAKDYLRRIEKEIDRINRIVRELLDFARPSKFEIRLIQVNSLIENTLSLLSYQKTFKNIETLLDLQADLPPIKGDESQLSQVLINIILNAIDAMPSGGTLTIQSASRVVEHAVPSVFPRPYARRRKGDPAEMDYSQMRKPDPLSALLTKFSRGDHLVKIRISDTGMGIKKEDIERIFDPFFTTKPPDKGTGLGLSVSLGIVESMGGEIKVESEVGKGSAFEIFFQAVVSSPQERLKG